MKCRHCENKLENVFLDLGFAPASNAYLNESDLRSPESYFPLKLLVCEKCWLVQTDDFNKADELFKDDYAYFSSVSKSWLKHGENYFNMVKEKYLLSEKSFVVEIASNDGYLLKNFVQAGIPCLGIEPTASTAAAAEKLNIPVLRKFFGEALGIELKNERKGADLIIGNNVYAHVPDINDFTAGMKKLLNKNGTITLEFPHLYQMIQHSQFDTSYHEHFSYLSLISVQSIFEKQGLRVVDVEEIGTHGGSLRIYGCHQDDPRKTSVAVEQLYKKELEFGLKKLQTYENFQLKADEVKNNLLQFLIEQKKKGKKVLAYGAAAKGNTLLNYAGIKSDLLECVFDAAPSKQNRFLPGSHLPIYSPSLIKEMKPDFVLILPWNISEEVKKELDYIKEWGARFVTAVPELRIF